MAVSSPSPDGLDGMRDLVDSSRPRVPLAVLRPGMIVAFFVVTIVVQMLPISQEGKGFTQAFIWAAFLAIVLHTVILLRAVRLESAELDRAEDMLVLRRYHEVIPLLKFRLRFPLRTPINRLRAMVLLATALGREERQDESLVICDALIDDEHLAGPVGTMVRLSRARIMLRSDHLYDADRAIGELRRQIDRGPGEVGVIDGQAVSLPVDQTAVAALRFLELYRDVKTGHAEEAVTIFEKNLELLRSTMGHRVGEAYALVAVAYDRLGRPAEAAKRFYDGTSLQVYSDIVRHYPEIAVLNERFPSAVAPARGAFGPVVA